MDFRDTLYCKIISSVVLFSFIWTFAGGADVAYAMKQDSPAASTPAREKSHAKKLAEALSSMETVLEDASLDIKGRKDKLAAYEEDLGELDAGMRADFKATEKHITDKGLPEAVLNRHKTFVERYEQNHAQLKKHIDELLTDMSAADFETKRQEVLKYLEGANPPKKHVPLDPLKLPHRAMEEKKAETEDYVPPTFPKLTPIKKKSMLERPELDSPYASLYEPFEGYPDEPILVASSGSLSGLLDGTSIASSTPASAEDLAETIDVKFTPAILAKAAELSNTPQAKSGALPIAIYEWVRNNVEYVPTWGSIQGADYCLQTMKCNSFDTASLLVALFRANGIHARYATVTGEMKIDRFMNWMGGFTNATAALDYAATGGMPVTGLVEGGQIKYVKFEQVIVLGWVDMEPSMGAKHRQGDTWIRFDPSFKEYTYTEGMNIANAVPFDAETLVNNLVSSATINETEGYVTGIDSSIINSAMETYRSQVEQYMTANHPNATVGDVLGTKKIIKHEFPILMGTLPYRTKTVHARYREIPDSLRHKLTFSVQADDMYYGTEPLSVTYSLPELAGKKVTLSYSPATADDEAIINSYLPAPHADGTPIDPSELPTSLPAYLINLKPELRIDGEVVATGGSVTMGASEAMYMTFHDPVRGDDVVSNVIEAGEYWGIAVDVAGVSGGMMDGIKTKLESTKAKLDSGDYAGLTKDDVLGDLLYTTAATYNAEMDVQDNVQARTVDIVNARFPSEAVFKTALDVDTSWGVPISVSAEGLMMDVDRNLNMVKAKDGSAETKKSFFITSGMNSSVLEHSVPEQLFSTTENPVEAVSAVKALSTANQHGIAIYTVTKDNASTVLPQLMLDSVVLNEIQNAVNAGKEVTVSQTDIAYAGFTGVGYIVIDPTTGEGAYLISGGESGASGLFELINIILTIIADDAIAAEAADTVTAEYGYSEYRNYIANSNCAYFHSGDYWGCVALAVTAQLDSILGAMLLGTIALTLGGPIGWSFAIMGLVALTFWAITQAEDCRTVATHCGD